MSSRCAALTRSGVRCRAWALRGSDFCFAHDPDRAADRHAARSKGGRSRHGRDLTGDVPLSLRSLADVPDVLDLAFADLQRCEASVSRSRALAYLAGVATRSFEVVELLARLEVVEGRLDSQGGVP